MNHLLLNYKTSLPAVVLIVGLLGLFVFLFLGKINPGGFQVCATTLIAVCTFLIGLGAKDADK